MSESRDWVANDEANTRLEEAKASLVNLASALGAGSPAGLKRADVVLAAAQAELSRPDCELVTSSMLSTLRGALTQLRDFAQAVTVAVQQGQGMDVDGLRVRLDDVSDALAPWPPRRRGKSIQLAADAVDLMAEQARAAIQPVEKRSEELSDSLNEKNQGMLQRLAEIGGHADELSGRLDAVNTRLTQVQEEIDGVTNEFRGAFTTEQAARTTGFEEQIGKAQANLDSFLGKAQEDTAARLNELDSYISTTRAELDGQMEETKKLVGAIGRKAQAGGYQEYANAQDWWASFWRWLTMACGMAAAAFAVVIGLTTTTTTGSDVWTALLRGVGAAAALAALAVYSSRQSAHHRESAVEARRLQLSLTAIGPCLQPLEDEERHRVLERCAYTFFANPPERRKRSKTEYPVLPQTAIEAIVDQLADALARRKPVE